MLVKKNHKHGKIKVFRSERKYIYDVTPDELKVYRQYTQS